MGSKFPGRTLDFQEERNEAAPTNEQDEAVITRIETDDTSNEAHSLADIISCMLELNFKASFYKHKNKFIEKVSEIDFEKLICCMKALKVLTIAELTELAQYREINLETLICCLTSLGLLTVDEHDELVNIEELGQDRAESVYQKLFDIIESKERGQFLIFCLILTKNFGPSCRSLGIELLEDFAGLNLSWCNPLKFFPQIAQGIGEKWIDLAKILDDEIDCDVIKEEVEGTSAQAMKFLERWKQKHGARATSIKLQIALSDIGESDLINSNQDLQ